MQYHCSRRRFIDSPFTFRKITGSTGTSARGPMVAYVPRSDCSRKHRLVTTRVSYSRRATDACGAQTSATCAHACPGRFDALIVSISVLNELE